MSTEDKNNQPYVCPMHPHVKSDKPGDCPECGMKLVLEETASEKKSENEDSYTPLLLIIGLISLVVATLALKDYYTSVFDVRDLLTNFMAGFFLVFSGFKLLDLKGFAEGYSTYDLLAKRWSAYGFVYPFIELSLGLAYLTRFDLVLTNWITLVVMVFSVTGVLIEISKKRKIQCYCLGTILKVPLTYVTVAEDIGMAAMATAMLLLSV